MRQAIATALDRLAREERVAILFAVESGSRAWGFPSPDSDWDVRFVYARPTEWHLSLAPGRDTLERALPDDLDLAGWDSRKAINLLLGGNAALREWLRSPILYQAVPDMLAAFRDLARSIPARDPARHHYRALIRKTVDRYLDTEGPVNLKKYFYALRPALALRWLRHHPEGEPPMDLPGLLAGVSLDPATHGAITALLATKARVSEIGLGDRLPPLDRLIAEEMAASENSASNTHRDPGGAEAGLALFRRSVALADAALA